MSYYDENREPTMVELLAMRMQGAAAGSLGDDLPPLRDWCWWAQLGLEELRAERFVISHESELSRGDTT